GSAKGCPQGPRSEMAWDAAAYKGAAPGCGGLHRSQGRLCRRSPPTVSLKPYWGKLTVRNFRGGRGNTGERCAPLPYSTFSGPSEEPSGIQFVRPPSCSSSPAGSPGRPDSELETDRSCAMKNRAVATKVAAWMP